MLPGLFFAFLGPAGPVTQFVNSAEAFCKNALGATGIAALFLILGMKIFR